MSIALDDSGAGKETVLERRGTFLRREKHEKISWKQQGRYVKCLYFGSQSDGNTTPDHSENDFLMSFNGVNIITVCEDWRAGMENYLMFHDDNTPPQQYLLQVIRRDTPEPATSLIHDALYW
ncbi:hypothetical protein DPMN_046974 [Dreissena polymorpha]|uniref:Uncharacterized protein n=1 Tax=Dreissena polymorpha TaxID=45954 RepID=A0A9D4I1F0_DREPO|nr:hypothetical protein DPMN_046974 [Dreissena polymorpha]